MTVTTAKIKVLCRRIRQQSITRLAVSGGTVIGEGCRSRLTLWRVVWPVSTRPALSANLDCERLVVPHEVRDANGSVTFILLTIGLGGDSYSNGLLFVTQCRRKVATLKLNRSAPTVKSSSGVPRSRRAVSPPPSPLACASERWNMPRHKTVFYGVTVRVTVCV
jgi:hypothetical protein